MDEQNDTTINNQIMPTPTDDTHQEDSSTANIGSSESSPTPAKTLDEEPAAEKPKRPKISWI